MKNQNLKINVICMLWASLFFMKTPTFAQSTNNGMPTHFALLMHSLEEYQDKNIYPIFVLLQKELEEIISPKEKKQVLALRTRFQKLKTMRKRIFEQKIHHQRNAEISPDSVMNFWEFSQKEETIIWQEMEKCVQKYTQSFEKLLRNQSNNMEKWRKDMAKIISRYERNENPETGIFLGKFNFGKFLNLVDVLLWQYEKMPQESQAQMRD